MEDDRCDEFNDIDDEAGDEHNAVVKVIDDSNVDLVHHSSYVRSRSMINASDEVDDDVTADSKDGGVSTIIGIDLGRTCKIPIAITTTIVIAATIATIDVVEVGVDAFPFEC